MFITDKHIDTLVGQSIHLKRYISALDQTLGQTKEVDRLDSLQAALERSIQMGVEILIDMCNLLIDVLIMRDPSSYADIVEIMVDEQVWDRKLGDEMLEIVHLRKILAHEYELIQSAEVWKQAVQSVDTFENATRKLIDYAKAGAQGSC